ncbi:MAG: AAA family ATPase [Treponema sp.]|nr:AAA family ATPase [Treponema sp.]
MKPLVLRLKNIGPYADETIDFTRLDNMFLITGNTGAGKTFIFDAMTYALYGELKGNRAGQVENLKSRYATDDEECYVDFTFEVGSKKYVCHRTVPFEYINSKGNKTRKTPSVDLAKIENGELVPVSNTKKVTETDAMIAEIIGLNATEFSQIVLLPQGAFADFLKKNSKDKRDTLQKIFPVLDYSRLMEIVKRKTDEAQALIFEKQTEIKSIQSDYDFSNASNYLSTMEEQISKQESRIKEINESQTKLQVQISNLERDLDEAEKLEKDKQRLEELKTQKKDFDRLKNKIELAEGALYLADAISRKKDAEVRMTESVEAEKEILLNQKENQKKYNELKLQESSMTELEKQLKKEQKEFDEIKIKLQQKDEYLKCLNDISKKEEQKELLKADFTQTSEQIKNLEKKYENQDINKLIEKNNSLYIELKEKLAILISDQEKAEKRDLLREKYNLSKTQLEKDNSDYDLLKNKMAEVSNRIEQLTEFLENVNSQNKAFSLGELLRPGCPCPVCGSTEHPRPAAKPENLSDEKEVLEAKKETLDSYKTQEQLYIKNISEKNAELKTFEEELDSFKNILETEKVKNQLEGLSENVHKLEKEKEELLTHQEKLKELNELYLASEKNLQLCESEIVNLIQLQQSIEKHFGDKLENLELRSKELEQGISEKNEVFTQWKDSFEKAEKQQIAIQKDVENSLKARTKAEEEFESAKIILVSKIQDSVFDSVEKAEEAFIDENELAEIKKSYSDYDKEVSLLKKTVEENKKAKSSIEVSAALEVSKTNLEESSKEFEENQQVLDEKKTEFNDYKKQFEKIKQAQSDLEDLTEKNKPLFLLNQDVSGNNPQKVTFDTWALGMYFEQVVEFASRRFLEITNGRFEFRLKNLEDKKKGNGFKGLDLMILDNYSNTLSDPASLSGGETFEASISLALAITDVVQSNNGGIRLDSLFIDEGFGTLDPEALDKAMAVFTELGESKMVGIISHVEGLQNLIPSAINVQKTPRGSTVEIK